MQTYDGRMIERLIRATDNVLARADVDDAEVCPDCGDTLDEGRCWTCEEPDPSDLYHAWKDGQDYQFKERKP